MQYTTGMAEYTNLKVQVHAPPSCHVNEGDTLRAPITEIWDLRQVVLHSDHYPEATPDCPFGYSSWPGLKGKGTRNTHKRRPLFSLESNVSLKCNSQKRCLRRSKVCNLKTCHATCFRTATPIVHIIPGCLLAPLRQDFWRGHSHRAPFPSV